MSERSQSAQRFSFLPSAARAAHLDHAVRCGLAESLSHLRDAVAIQYGEARGPLDRCTSLLDSGRVRPGLFALYSDLVEAISTNDEANFRSAIHALGAVELKGFDRLHAVALGDGDLGEGMAERFSCHIDHDPTQKLAISSIAAGELDAARHRLDDTIAMLQQAAPELAGEICGLASEVIFVDSLPRAGESALESASTFYLWGAVFLNAKAFPDRVAMAEALTHEGAHALLHGLMLGSPLVENDEYERYSSPLRPDARPLEGVVHATYVLARMHYCVEQLLRSGCLTDAERAQASAALAAHKAAYRDGLATVAAHARFTAAGAAIFDAARDYMRTRIPQDLTT